MSGGTVGREVVFERGPVTIIRLNGPPRSVVDGRHRRLIGYVGPTVMTWELVGLLRQVAEDLAKSLPRDPV